MSNRLYGFRAPTVYLLVLYTLNIPVGRSSSNTCQCPTLVVMQRLVTCSRHVFSYLVQFLHNAHFKMIIWSSYYWIVLIDHVINVASSLSDCTTRCQGPGQTLKHPNDQLDLKRILVRVHACFRWTDKWLLGLCFWYLGTYYSIIGRVLCPDACRRGYVRLHRVSRRVATYFYANVPHLVN